MTTDAPNRKPDSMRALLEQHWHRLTRRQKCEVEATVAAMVDGFDFRLTVDERLGLAAVLPRHDMDESASDRLTAWLVQHNYLTVGYELGPRSLAHLPN